MDSGPAPTKSAAADLDIDICRTRVNPSSDGASTMCNCTSENDGGKTKNAPVCRGVFEFSYFRKTTALRGGLCGRAVDHLRLRAGGDRNVAGLLGLWDLADEIDVEQAVLERGVFHHHEIGKLEHTLEGARRDAAMQHLGFVLAVFIGCFFALDRQRLFLRDDRKLALREAGNR